MEFNINDLITKDKKTIEDGGQTQAKRGRPKKDKPKKNAVAVYFDDDIYQQIEDKASAVGLTKGAYIASLVFRDLKND